MTSQDENDLKLYFESLGKLKGNFDKIDEYENTNIDLKNNLKSQRKDTIKVIKLKTLIDSAYQVSKNPPVKVQEKPYELKTFKNNFENFEIETHTYSDTIKKKGLMGRLKDAISGNVDVKKESTVITLKNKKAVDIAD